MRSLKILLKFVKYFRFWDCFSHNRSNRVQRTVTLVFSLNVGLIHLEEIRWKKTRHTFLQGTATKQKKLDSPKHMKKTRLKKATGRLLFCRIGASKGGGGGGWRKEKTLPKRKSLGRIRQKKVPSLFFPTAFCAVVLFKGPFFCQECEPTTIRLKTQRKRNFRKWGILPKNGTHWLLLGVYKNYINGCNILILTQ